MNQFKKLIKISTNKKIVNLVNPNNHQDATTRKYVDKKKTETIYLFSFSSKYASRNLFIETFVKEKSNILASF